MYSKVSSIAASLLRKANDTRNNNSKIYIFIHKSVDGDCIGSSSALCMALRSLGFDSYVVMEESLPWKMTYLDIDNLFISPNDIDSEELGDNGNSLCIATDCSVGDRMGAKAGELFDGADEARKMIIDHHKSVTLDGDSIWVVPEASSASELMCYLIEELSKLEGRDLITKKIAYLLLVGMVTDTGRFSYTNTRPETLVTAARLMQYGASLQEIRFNFFDLKNKADLKAVGYLCSNVEFALDGRIATSIADKAFLEDYEPTADAMGEAVSKLRNVKGVDLAVVLREVQGENGYTGEVRMNFRSSNKFDSALFASNFGGGGHSAAAGATIKCDDIYALRDKVVAMAAEVLVNADGE